MQQPALHFEKLSGWNRIKITYFNSFEECRATRQLTFVLGKETTCPEAGDAPGFEFAVIVKAQHLACGENLQSLLREGLTAVSEVVHCADRAIREAQLNGKSVWTRLAVSDTEELQIFDGARSQMAQEVHEMASLTKQATTAKSGVLCPVI